MGVDTVCILFDQKSVPQIRFEVTYEHSGFGECSVDNAAWDKCYIMTLITQCIRAFVSYYLKPM